MPSKRTFINIAILGMFIFASIANAATCVGPFFGGTGVCYPNLWTQGAIPFGNGNTLLGTSTNLFWNNTSNLLGIGTSTPFWSLTVASSTGPQLSLVDGTSSSTAWTFRSISNTLYLATSTALATSTTPIITITPNGLVGIGTTTPLGSLDVFNSGNPLVGNVPQLLVEGTSNNVEMQIANWQSGARKWGFSVSNGGALGNGTLQIREDVVGNTRMVILGAGATNPGFVGIGTTTPNGQLTVSNSTLPQLSLTDTTPTSNAWTLRSISNNFYIATSSYTATSTTAAVRIDPNGAVYLPSSAVTSANQTGYWCYDANNQLIRDTIVCVAVSARRFKQDIHPLDVGLSELLQLQPVSYKLKPSYNTLFANDPNYNGTQYSLVADDVQKIDPKLTTVETSTTTFEGKTYAPGTVHGLASYENWVALFTQSIKDFYAQFQGLVARVSGLENRLNQQQAQIDHLQAEINNLKK